MDELAGRDADLDAIESVLGDIRLGEGTNLCILGVPGMGKTTLLRGYIQRHRERWEDEGVIPVYISLRDLGDSPQELAAGLVGEVLARVAFTFRSDIDISELRRPETFASSAAAIHSPSLEAFLAELRDLPAGTDEQPRGMVRSAFAFPNAFAEEKRIRILLFVDDFDELKKYGAPGMSAYREFLEALDSQTEAFCITAMTHTPFAHKLFLDDDAPLAGRFRVRLLSGLPPEALQRLALQLLSHEGPDAERAASVLARLAGGNPLVLRHLARAASAAAPEGGPPGTDAVASAFASEVLSPLGKVYRHYLGSLQRAVEDKTSFPQARRVLATLAEGRSTTPEEIKSRAGIDIETAARMVGRILGSGLFRKVDEAFYFDDPLFRFWALKTDPGGPHGDGRLPPDEARALAEEYLTSFLEPGGDEPAGKPAPHRKGRPAAAKKFNFRDLVAHVKGRTLPGGPLGSEDEVSFPAFGKVKGFAFSTRQVKMYYLEAEEAFWGMMIVWWKMAVDRGALELFTDRAGGRLDRLWFVCRGGFTDEARALARERGVLVSDEQDLKTLLENLA